MTTLVQKLNESGHGCLDHKIGFGLEVLGRLSFLAGELSKWELSELPFALMAHAVNWSLASMDSDHLGTLADMSLKSSDLRSILISSGPSLDVWPLVKGFLCKCFGSSTWILRHGCNGNELVHVK